MNVPEPEFIRLQRAFARHLRDPAGQPSPVDREQRRLDIYRHAVFANVEGFMRDNYPRIRAVTDERRWQALVRDYIVRHASGASAFVDVPEEFIDYLENERNDAGDPPFLAELARFDWLETLVGADERRVTLDGVDREGDLLAGIPVANPVLRIETYRYPVHAIGPEFLPEAPPVRSTRIAAFRDLDNRYGFLDLNDAAARLLELVVEDRQRRGEDILHAVADELGHDDVDGLIDAGSTILGRMRERAVLLGTRLT